MRTAPIGDTIVQTMEVHMIGMKPQIDGAAYGPETLKALTQAFDAAWVDIAGNFGENPAEVERARTSLAEALMAVASEDCRDPEALRRGALVALAIAR